MPGAGESHAHTGALIGAVVGGVGFGFYIYDRCESDQRGVKGNCSGPAMLGAATGAVAGALVGAIIGRLM